MSAAEPRAELGVENAALSTAATVIALHGGSRFDQGYLRPGLAPARVRPANLFVEPRSQGTIGQRPRVETCTLEQTADEVLAAHPGVEHPCLLGHSAVAHLVWAAQRRVQHHETAWRHFRAIKSGGTTTSPLAGDSKELEIETQAVVRRWLPRTRGS